MVFSAFKKNIAALGILVDSSVPFEIRIFLFYFVGKRNKVAGLKQNC